MINWLTNKMFPKVDLPDVTGCTLMEAAKKMEGYPFHPSVYVLIKAMIHIIEGHEAKIKELEDKMDK